MSSDIVREREALQELISTEGWQYFVARVLQEWEGAGYRARMRIALESADPVAPKVVHRASEELLRLLSWPENRVRDLKGVVD